MVVGDGGSFLKNTEVFLLEIKYPFSYYLDASSLNILWKIGAWFKIYDENTLSQQNYCYRKFRSVPVIHCEIFVF